MPVSMAIFFVVFFVSPAFAQLTVSPAVCPGSLAPDVERVLEVASGIIDADNKGDLDRVLGFYAPEVLMMPPNESPVGGLAAIRPRYEWLFRNFSPAIIPRVDEVCVSGGLAFVSGRNGGRMVSKTGGADIEMDDVYLMMLRREASGRWLITHLIWHRAGPAKEGGTSARRAGRKEVESRAGWATDNRVDAGRARWL